MRWEEISGVAVGALSLVFGRPPEIYDDTASCCERPGDLAHRLGDRKVPGREGCYWTDGLDMGNLERVGLAGGNDTAIGAPAFLGEPFRDVGAVGYLGLGFAQRLALFAGDGGRNDVAPFAQQLGGLAQDVAAGHGRLSTPGPEAAGCKFQRPVQIGDACNGKLRDRLVGGGILHRQHVAVARLEPAANVKRWLISHSLVHLIMPIGPPHMPLRR